MQSSLSLPSNFRPAHLRIQHWLCRHVAYRRRHHFCQCFRGLFAMNTSFVASLLLALAAAAHADLQSTAFTYQGSLKANGAPLNGPIDLTFTLYDAATIGNQVSSPIVLLQVPVTNGVIAEDLDFGDVFTGQQLWLEVTAGSQTLTPRQTINSVPAARYTPQVFIGGSTNVFTPPGNGSLVPISGMYTNGAGPALGTLNPDQSITVNSASTATAVELMPTSGRLTRIFGTYFRGMGGNLPGTLSARLYLGDAGTTTLTPTSLVCNFTLTSTTTTTGCSGTSIVSYTAGQQAAIVVTGASVTVGTVSISMAP
jgi:hypothetical protein